MSIVGEIADTLQLLARVVNDTRTLVKSINDGREYLARKHPDAANDFKELLEQMQITVEGLASVTGVVTGFRFTVGSEYAQERDLARFNEYVIDQGKKIEKLRGEIRTLKGSCDRIRELQKSLNKRDGEGWSWSSMFGLLGVEPGPSREDLADAIGEFYTSDERMIETIEETLRLAELALADVDSKLGPPGEARAFNVPAAAQMLRVYAGAFQKSQQDLRRLVKDLEETEAALAG